jgi:ATP-dependent Clp protease ATP-binding subunit ClpC
MFERFTDRARRVVVLAQEESQLLSHNYIGSEHLLLGLLAEQDGAAARALESLNVTLGAAREQVEEIIGPGQQTPHGHIPFTPRAKKILELSLREALIMGSEVIDTQHLLLGLIDEGDGVGAQILQRLDATPQAVREAVARLINAGPEAAGAAGLTGPGSEPRAVSMARPVRIRGDALAEVMGLLVDIDQRLSAIERHLGIGPGREEPPAGPTQAEAEGEAEAE